MLFPCFQVNGLVTQSSSGAHLAFNCLSYNQENRFMCSCWWFLILFSLSDRSSSWRFSVYFGTWWKWVSFLETGWWWGCLPASK